MQYCAEPFRQEDQQNDLEAHWPPDHLVGNRAHDWDGTVVFRGQPHTTDRQNIKFYSVRHSSETGLELVT